ncbi:MAG: periplasmic heavy metal sensor [Alphaproteobacteria bacterium]|nr:periplasmic heavy metal sensor [Alphaproteobacteria bacterium]
MQDDMNAVDEKCGTGSKCGGCMKAVVGLVLFLSLAGNIYMAGRIAGSHGATGSRVTKLAGVLSAFADLSPESRGKAVDIVKKSWPEIEKEIKSIRATRKEVKEMMGQESFKRADLDKKFAELRKEVTALQTTGQNMAADIAQAVTPEERMKLVKSIDIKP